MRDYRLASSIGRPMDGAIAIARCIVRGLFEKFPTLKLVGTHLGGGICEMIQAQPVLGGLHHQYARI